ncbi:hypothetical protein EDD22DRAFT_982741 [Suillus occidentalis]|nr:hypothetical protein EDD22DRAFT_982741 [Suillus occidentalis]
MHACHPVALAQDFLPIPPQSPPPPGFSPPPPGFSPPPPDFLPPPPDFLPPPPDVSPPPPDVDEDPESEFTDASGRYYRMYHSLLNDHKDLHKVIDATQLGNVPWQCLLVQYAGECPEHDTPLWMGKDYEVWYRDPRMMAHNMLANTTYKEYDLSDNTRRWKDFMSGDWAWQQADEISKDLNTHGSMFVPIILGSDKTTVSVGMGNNEYYPLYASIGNVHNNVQRAHCDALVIIGFLSIPKTTRKYAHDDSFHSHFRRIIFGLGPYIADYEEQLVLSCTVKNWCLKCLAHWGDLDGGGNLPRTQEHTDLLVSEHIDSDTLWHEFGIVSVLVVSDTTPLSYYVLIYFVQPFTNDFPQANIHKLISFDLLHQLVKGAFKDHLVDWVLKYLKLTHGTKRGEEIRSDIDRSQNCCCGIIALGLRRFPGGHGFKQWTGNDSKALMKVFLPAIEGHVPQDMVRAFRALLEFYIQNHRHSPSLLITSSTLNDSLGRHDLTVWCPKRIMFVNHGIQHIKAVKEPWRWSNKHNALGQMLLTNQQLDKLAASRLDFAARRMLVGSVLSRAVATLKRKRARTVMELADEVNVPHLRRLIRYFLFSQLHPNDPRSPEDVPAASCPRHDGRLYVFNSAAATFYAPSDPSGIGGMRREQIRACPLWRNVAARNDCVFVNANPDLEGMRGLEVARVKCFFSFKFNWVTYPCALVQWFDKVGDCADEDTGMWIVRPTVHDDGTPNFAPHLIPVYGPDFIADNIEYFHSYDAFRSLY